MWVVPINIAKLLNSPKQSVSARECRDMCTHVRAHSIEIKQTRARSSMAFGCVLIIPVKQVADTRQICDEKVFIAHFVTVEKLKKKTKKETAEAITAWAMRKLERWETEKTGKAAWWVFLIDVWPQPSCLPAPPASAGICRLTPLPSPHTANTRGGTHFFFYPVITHSPAGTGCPHASSQAREALPLCRLRGSNILRFLSKWFSLKSSSVLSMETHLRGLRLLSAALFALAWHWDHIIVVLFVG